MPRYRIHVAHPRTGEERWLKVDAPTPEEAKRRIDDGEWLIGEVDDLDVGRATPPQAMDLSVAPDLSEAPIESPSPDRYEYRMRQIPPVLDTGSTKEVGNEAATYLEQLVNSMAGQGWEFFRVDAMGVYVRAGCLGALMGKRAERVDYYVVTFRRPV